MDASITAAWCFDDEQTNHARSLLRRAKAMEVIVPSIWSLEMANVLLVNERRGRISTSDAARYIGLLGELLIVMDRQPIMQPFDATMNLARRFQLSSYDAAYVELAVRVNAPLATLDRKMQRVCAGAGVPIL